MGGTGPRFQTLLTSGRPKQSASSRFCSHTVQAPAKPKPLHSHSIASKPWMVRRAVWLRRGGRGGSCCTPLGEPKQGRGSARPGGERGTPPTPAVLAKRYAC